MAIADKGSQAQFTDNLANIFKAQPPITIPANGSRIFQGRTRFLTVISATAADNLQVSFDGKAFIDFPRGFVLTDFDAPAVWFKDTSGSNNTIVIGTGLAALRDNRFAITPGQSVPVNIVAGGGSSLSLGQALMAASLPVVIASNQSAIPVTSAGGALTDGSGTIAAGGVSQAVFALNAARRYFFFQNLSADVLWINFGVAAAATQPSIAVPVGGSFAMEGSFVSTQAINVIGATIGDAFTAKQG